MMSSDYISRAHFVAEREDLKKKKRKKNKMWIKGLSIVSSEEDSDHVIQEYKLDESKIIALRFPYPMLSDDSDDEDDLKYFPKNLNKVEPYKVKRKYISSSDENNKCKRKVKKKKSAQKHKNTEDRVISKCNLEHEDNEHSVKSDKEGSNNDLNLNYDKLPRRNIVSYSSSDEEHIHKKNMKLYNSRFGKMSSYSDKCSTTIDLNLKKHNSGKSPCKDSGCFESFNKPSEEVVKTDRCVTVGVNIPPKCEKNSRFLDSSSYESGDEEDKHKFHRQNSTVSKSEINTPNPKYRRIHILSTSDSNSDNDVSHTHKSTKNTKMPTSRRKNDAHFLSTSDREDNDDNIDHFTNENDNTNSHTKNMLCQETSIGKHPCYNLLKSFNNTEPQQSVNHTIDKKDHLALHSKKKLKIESSAWGNITNIPMKSKQKSSNTSHLKIDDLKKKFVSSNISSVEIHKQIKNRSLGLKCQNKITSSRLPTAVEVNSNRNSILDKLNENKTTFLHNNAESRQPIENKYTVNVNVFCSPSHTNGSDDIEHQDNLSRSANQSSSASDQANLDIKLSLHNNENDNIVSDYVTSKKVRISRINKDSNSINRQDYKTSTSTNKPLKLKKSSTLNSNMIKNTTTDVRNQDSKNGSDGCDVLGNILSEMENNPYRKEKPIKKDPKTDFNSWSPNPLPFPSNTQTFSIPTNFNIVQSDVVIPLSKSCVTTPSSAAIASEVRPSKLRHHETNRILENKNINKTLKGSSGSSSAIVSFYSTNSDEYLSKEVISTPSDQTKCGNDKLCTNQLPNIEKMCNSAVKESEIKNLHTIKKYAQTDNKDKISNTPLNINNRAKCNKNELMSEQVHCGGLEKHIAKAPIKEIQNKGVDSENSINNQKLTDSALNKEDSGNDNSKGIRIKIGGTVFRLPGKNDSSSVQSDNPSNKLKIDTMGSKNIENSISSDHKNVKSSITSAPKTDISYTANGFKDKDQSLFNSEDSEASSDSTLSSDSSDSSAESINSSNEKSLTGEVTNISPNRRCSTEKDMTLENQHGVGLGIDSSLHILKTEKTKEVNGICNEIDENIIVLSDSSDTDQTIHIPKESSNFQNKDQHDILKEKVPLSKINTVNDNNEAVTLIGKIRVKSLRDLGVKEMYPIVENAQSWAISSGQHLHSTCVIPATPSRSETGKNPLPIHNQQIKSKNHLVLKADLNKNKFVTSESHHTSLASNRSKSEAFKSKERESQINVSDSTLSVNQTTVVPEPVHHTSVKSIVQRVESKEKISQINVSNSILPVNEDTAVPEPESYISVQPIVQRVQSQNREIGIPLPISKEAITLFINLCDNLFTEVVWLKIPKLVDDLHLSIIHDKLQEDRLKKIDQLISPETRASERRRAEKDFANIIKKQSQSFVPLFMTIVNKISKENLTTLVMTLYCRIVYQLERADPINAQYRFKLKDIIKCMLQKHSSPETEPVLALFNSNITSFITVFDFLESLIFQYDLILEERQRKSLTGDIDGQKTVNQSDNTNNKQPREGDDISKSKSTDVFNVATTELPATLQPPPTAPTIHNKTANIAPNTTVILNIPVLKQPESKTQQLSVSVTADSTNTTKATCPSSTSQPPKTVIGNLDALILNRH